MRASGKLGSAGRFEVAVVAALFAAAIVNAMFSGDIQTNGEIWLVAGLAVGLGPARRSTPSEIFYRRGSALAVLAGHTQLEA